MKSAVLVVALAAQCAPVKSWIGYDYSDETSAALEWLAHLKRLSLIALMLCGVILYYVPESRPLARRTCCALIDLVANGLKFALTATEYQYEYEEIKADEQDQLNDDLRIQELYQKACESDTMNCEEVCIDETNIDYDGVSIRGQRSDVEGQHDRRRGHHRTHRHFRNVEDVPSRFRMLIRGSQQRIALIDEERERADPLAIRRDASWRKRVTARVAEESEDNINFRQAEPTEDREREGCDKRDIKMESPSSSVPGITNDSDVDYGLMRESDQLGIDSSISLGTGVTTPRTSADQFYCCGCSDRPSPARIPDKLERIDRSPNKESQTVTRTTSQILEVAVNNVRIDKNLQDRQSIDQMKYEKIVSACQSRSKNDCATKTVMEEIACFSLGAEVSVKRELHDKLLKNRRRFLNDVKSMIDDQSCEHEPIATNRAKPVLWQIASWFFSSCPGASRRSRE